PGHASSPERTRGWHGVLAYAAVLLVIAVLQHRHAFSLDWVASGKTNAGLVRQGEWWRTVTALSLHSGVEHLAANLVFGGLFGLFTGRLLGSGLAWASILAAGAVGNAMNAWVQPVSHSAIGASTAVFGALGILSSYAWKQRRGIGDGWIRRWTPVVGGVLLLAYTGLGGERTDVIAHVTGFMSGLLLGGLYGAMGRRIYIKAWTQSLLGLTALALLAVCWLLASGANG
ncbi:MAG: rhomboid family intramembrane serine protease, partial [Planctomycetota bacterium]